MLVVVVAVVVVVGKGVEVVVVACAWVQEAARRLVAARAGQGLQCRLPRQRLLSLEVAGDVPSGPWMWWQGSRKSSMLLPQAALVAQNSMLLSQAALASQLVSQCLTPRQRLRLCRSGIREVF